MPGADAGCDESLFEREHPDRRRSPIAMGMTNLFMWYQTEFKPASVAAD
jgi:hypothetical protein